VGPMGRACKIPRLLQCMQRDRGWGWPVQVKDSICEQMGGDAVGDVGLQLTLRPSQNRAVGWMCEDPCAPAAAEAWTALGAIQVMWGAASVRNDAMHSRIRATRLRTGDRVNQCDSAEHASVCEARTRCAPRLALRGITARTGLCWAGPAVLQCLAYSTELDAVTGNIADNGVGACGVCSRKGHSVDVHGDLRD
jgi:hypothetical protein